MIYCMSRLCDAVTNKPGRDGWTYYAPEDTKAIGFYCPHHAKALENFLHWELEEREPDQ